MTTVPEFASGGMALWDAITEEHVLDATQLVQLEEACRAKDRLDKLDALLRGDVETWAAVMHNARTEDYELKIDAALTQANATANLMKQLLAALRLPDSQTGKKPQYRGPRGAQAPTVPGGKVSSLDRARARAAAKG
jgi:ABC-type Na+ efflux pump permease subunit